MGKISWVLPVNLVFILSLMLSSCIGIGPSGGISQTRIIKISGFQFDETLLTKMQSKDPGNYLVYHLSPNLQKVKINRWKGQLMFQDPGMVSRVVSVTVQDGASHRYHQKWYLNDDGSISKKIADGNGKTVGVFTIALDGSFSVSIDLNHDDRIDYLGIVQKDLRETLFINSREGYQLFRALANGKNPLCTASSQSNRSVENNPLTLAACPTNTVNPPPVSLDGANPAQDPLKKLCEQIAEPSTPGFGNFAYDDEPTPLEIILYGFAITKFLEAVGPVGWLALALTQIPGDSSTDAPDRDEIQDPVTMTVPVEHEDAGSNTNSGMREDPTDDTENGNDGGQPDTGTVIQLPPLYITAGATSTNNQPPIGEAGTLPQPGSLAFFTEICSRRAAHQWPKNIEDLEYVAVTTDCHDPVEQPISGAEQGSDSGSQPIEVNCTDESASSNLNIQDLLSGYDIVCTTVKLTEPGQRCPQNVLGEKHRNIGIGYGDIIGIEPCNPHVCSPP